MSNRAIDWAIETPARGSAKSVLFVLANAASDKPGKSSTGRLWPPLHAWMAHASIAAKAGIDIKTVPAALAKLEAGGFIERAGQDGESGQVRVYRLTIKVPESGGLGEGQDDPENGDLAANQRSPFFPAKVPGFSVKGPRFSRSRSPKPGDESQGNPKGTQVEPKGCALGARGPGDLFGDSASADPGPKPKRSPSKNRPKGRGSETREAYATAFRAMYGVEPVIAAKENSQFARVFDAVGSEEAPKLAAFFVSDRNQTAYHAQRMHPPELLVRDLSALRAQMLTGKPARINGKHATPSFTTKDYHQGVPK